MKLNKWRALGATAFLTLTLAACNAGEQSAAKEKEATVETAEAQQAEASVEKHAAHEEGHDELSVGVRYVVSSEVGLHILNEKFEQIEQFNIGTGAFTVADSGRYVFVRDAVNKDSYTLLDSGLYVEDHGNHMHPYEEKPILAPEVQASKPAHMISHAGHTAIFNDGNGQVDVYENHNLTTDGLKPSFVYEGVAHHGAAVPLSTDELAVTYVANEGDSLPIGVKIVDAKGQETAVVTNSCDSLHGTAYGGTGEKETIAFGCAGKVVVYNVATKKTIEAVLPDAGARASTVEFGQDSDYLVTNYSVKDEPQTKVGIGNVQSGEVNVVELPAAYKSAILAAPENKAYVLAEDGNVYQLNLTTASIDMTISALNPFNLEEESPALFMVNDKVLIMVPGFQKVYEIHGNHVHESVKFDFVPTAIAAVEAK